MVNSVGDYFTDRFIDGNYPSKKTSSVIFDMFVSLLLIKKNLLMIL
jgi:hypothetical protein